MEWHYHPMIGNPASSLMSHTHDGAKRGHAHPGPWRTALDHRGGFAAGWTAYRIGPAHREPPPLPPDVLDKVARIISTALDRQVRRPDQ